MNSFWIAFGFAAVACIALVIVGGLVDVLTARYKKKAGVSDGLDIAQTTLEAAIPLVQFAVANLDPSQVIWPYDKLKLFGECLKACKHMDYFTQELGGNIIEFAEEFKNLRNRYERERDENRLRAEIKTKIENETRAEAFKQVAASGTIVNLDPTLSTTSTVQLVSAVPLPKP